MTRFAEDGPNAWFRVEWSARKNGDYEESFFTNREEALDFAQAKAMDYRSVLVSEKGKYQFRRKIRLGFVYFWWRETDCKEWGDLPEAGYGYPLGVRGDVLQTLHAYQSARGICKCAKVTVDETPISVNATVENGQEQWEGNLSDLADGVDIWIEADSLDELQRRMRRAHRIWQEGERHLER